MVVCFDGFGFEVLVMGFVINFDIWVSEWLDYGFFFMVSEVGVWLFDVYVWLIVIEFILILKIVVIVIGLGLSEMGMQNVIDWLFVDIIFVLVFYGGDFDLWMQQVCMKGYELLLQLLFELFDFFDNDFGLYILLVSLCFVEMLDWFVYFLICVINYVGVIGEMGVWFVFIQLLMQYFLEKLEFWGFMFVDNGMIFRSIFVEVVGMIWILFSGVDVVLDEVFCVDSIDVKFL